MQLSVQNPILVMKKTIFYKRQGIQMTILKFQSTEHQYIRNLLDIIMSLHLELISFSWPCFNFQGHRASLCFKLNFVCSILLAVFHWCFQILTYGELELINCLWTCLNFQGHRGSLWFTIYFVYAIFLGRFCQWLSNIQVWRPWTRPWIG